MFMPFTGAAAGVGGEDIRSIDFESGDSDSYETSTNLSAIGTGDFTLEAWVKPESLTAQMAVMGIGGDISFSDGCVLFIETDGDTTAHVGSSSNRFNTNTVTTGSWQHIAMVRSSGTVEIFVDGVSEGTTSLASSLGARRVLLAQRDQVTAGREFDGLIYRARWSNTARYTTGFTPSKTYTTDANTVAMIVAKGPNVIDLEGRSLITNGSPAVTTDIPT